MSAKWRRNKKGQDKIKRINIFKARNSSRGKGPVDIENFDVKRYKKPYIYKISNIYKAKKWKEPKPLIDVFEDENEITVLAEIAGFKEENLKIRVKNQRLTLSAKSSGRKYYKSLTLPHEVIPESLHTTFKNGVLQIRLRKAEEKAVSKIAG